MVTHAVKEKAIVRNINSQADYVKQFPNGELRVSEVGEHVFTLLRLHPGWKWSADMKLNMGTDSCRVGHVQYVLGGRLSVRMDDGSTFELKPGDAAIIPPGHDAYVVGHEDFIAIDLSEDFRDLLKG